MKPPDINSIKSIAKKYILNKKSNIVFNVEKYIILIGDNNEIINHKTTMGKFNCRKT